MSSPAPDDGHVVRGLQVLDRGHGVVCPVLPVPEPVLGVATALQDVLLASALVGLGPAVRIGELVSLPGRTIARALCCWALIA